MQCKRYACQIRGWKLQEDRPGQRKPAYEVNYYAHTAVNADGMPEKDPAKWQLLSTHVENVSVGLRKHYAS